jgi:DNA-binding transcriptional regulator YiaG
MLVAEKMHHTRKNKVSKSVGGKKVVYLKPDTPQSVVSEIRKQYAEYVVPVKNEQYLEWNDTTLCKEISARMTPGCVIKEMRQIYKLSQKELGLKLGGIAATRVSDWENGHRNVSKDVAKKLALLFKLPIDKFI